MMGTRDGGVYLVCELLYRILVISVFMSVAAAEDITYIYWHWHIKNSPFSLIRTAFSRKVPFLTAGSAPPDLAVINSSRLLCGMRKCINWLYRMQVLNQTEKV
jgi:hypothetical protein